MNFDWQKGEYDAGFVAKIGNITLGASPDRVTHFGTKPKRGTKWRACVSIFDGKFTISRYGRDCYDQLCDTAKDAMRLAEQVYNDELAARKAV